MQTDKGVVPGDCTGSGATSRKSCFASPQCDRAHLCAGDHASESQDLLDPCRDLERRPSRSAGGTFAATYRIDFQHAGLVATNARCAKRQASIGTPSTTKDNRGARSTRRLAASNPSEPMAETSSRRRSDDRAAFARPRNYAALCDVASGQGDPHRSSPRSP